MRAKRIRLISLGVTALALGGATVWGPHSTPAHSATPVAQDDDVVDQLAAAQLSKDQGIDFDTALARISRQPDIIALDEQLQKSVPSYAGLWVDQANLGTVNVQIASAQDESDASSLIASSGVADISKLEQVTYSLKDLENYEDQLTSAPISDASNGAADVTSAVNVQNNDVEVSLTDTGSAANAAGQAKAWIDAQINAGAPYVITPGEGIITAGASCSEKSCDPPLIGGPSITDQTNWPASAYCTAGFDVVSNSDGKPYIATAGHCNYQSTWYRQFSSTGDFHEIGGIHHDVFGPTDAEIITINNPSGWDAPTNTVLVDSSDTPEYPTTYNDAYAITGIGDENPQGIYLCHTGATIGTNCGEVVSPDAHLTYEDDATGATEEITNMIETSFNICEGDSGGPVYVEHKAYGIAVAYYTISPYGYDVTGLNGNPKTLCAAYRAFVVKMTTIDSTMNTSLYSVPVG